MALDNIPSPPPALPEDSGFPTGLTYVGIAVGGASVLVGAFMLIEYPRIHSVGLLSICVGFGIILAAFGARAAGTWKTWSVAGCGALAVLLYMVLFYFKDDSDLRYAAGDILQTRDIESVTGVGSENFLVGRTGGSENFRFVLFPNDMNSKEIFFNFVPKDKANFQEFYIGCISSEFVRVAMDSGVRISLSLEFNKAKNEYSMSNNADGKPIGTFLRTRCPAQETAPGGDSSAENPSGGSASNMGFLSIAAAAQPVSIDDLLTQIESDSGDDRESAREALGALRDEGSYAAMAAKWDITNSSYRGDLGRLVAWSTAINGDRAMAVMIANALSADQLAYLVQLTGQGDVTLRRFATEVLHRLLETTNWPSGPPAARAQEIVDSTTKVFTNPDAIRVIKPGVSFKYENMAYNTLVAIDFTQCNIENSYREAILDVLTTYKPSYLAGRDLPKITAKLDATVGTLHACKT